MAEESKIRIEIDSMGEMAVPSSAYYGASTARARINFPISDLRFSSSFIVALALIKSASAMVNREYGLLEPAVANAIIEAADLIVAGKYHDQFVVDVFQTGSGTSTNMNMNEVLANLAIEILGGEPGDRKKVHPNDHVNLGSSSNDVIPTAIHIAALTEIKTSLRPALELLLAELTNKAKQFMPIVKTGRTHLQDATPIRLGQEFSGYAAQIEKSLERLDFASRRLSQVALGGTAVGTGMNTRTDFANRVLNRMSGRLGIDLFETNNHFQAQSTIDEVVLTSSILKGLAISLMKIANDLRFLSSGPRAGFAEIELPEVQPGSSIMPGKVNPVIAESVCMVCAQVIGNDTTICIAGQSGNFELNVMLPVACYNLLQSISLLAKSATNLSVSCVRGITPTAKGPQLVERGLSLCTALVPELGYDMAAKISKHACENDQSIYEAAKELTDMEDGRLKSLLDPGLMTGPYTDID